MIPGDKTGQQYTEYMDNKTSLLADRRTRISPDKFNNSIYSPGSDRPVDILLDEGGDSFYKYANWFGLVTDNDLVVLSSMHHYFYDAEEMKNVKTIINIKELNQIKLIKDLLHSCLDILPQINNFLGCFVDNKKINGYVLNDGSYSGENRKRLEASENGIVSRFPFLNMIYSIMDSRTNTYLSEKSVSLLLEDYGFKIVDMTEIKGLTYFYSQKIGAIYN
jgi:hypothetical protein